MLKATHMKIFADFRIQLLEVVVAGARTPAALVGPLVLLVVLLAVAGTIMEQGVKKPRTSKHFDDVSNPEATVIVLGNPRLSQAVVTSKPGAEEGGKDCEGEGPADKNEVG
jgi:hypothetical protein